MAFDSAIHRLGWVADYGAHRTELNTKLGIKTVPDRFERRVDPRAGQLVARLEAAGIPKDLASEHGALLAPAIKDAAAIKAFVEGLGWNGRTFGRVVAQFYKTLKVSLHETPEPMRAEAAQRSIAALHAAIVKTKDGDRLVPAIGAVVSLFDFETRQIAQRSVSRPAPEQAVESAVASVESLAASLGDRPGIGRALTLYPALVEQLERAYGPLPPAKRRDLRDRTARFLVELGPLSGFAPETAGRLSMAVTRAIPKAKTADGALALAGKAFRASFAEKRNEAKKQLEQAYDLPAPKQRVLAAVDKALAKVMEAHPTAPDSFYQQVTSLRSNLQGQISYDYSYGNNQSDPKAFLPLAKLVERFGPTELGAPLLTWANQIYYSIRYQQKGGAAVARAAQQTSVPKVARQLAEASVRLGGYEPDKALLKELAALETLPPTTAMATALALHATLSGYGQQKAPVVRAIIREAKKGAKDDPYTHLSKFAERVGPLLTSLANHGVQARQQEELAIHLARVSASVKYLGNAAEGSAQLIASIQKQLPKANVRELIEASDDGRAGIWQLVDPGVRWRVQPQPLFDQVLEKLGKRVAKEDAFAQTRAARFALELAQVIGNLDGDHNIPFNQILADVDLAFTKPGKLTYAARRNTAAGLRAQQNESPLNFLREHSQLPMELAFSAGLHLNASQLAWLCEKCSTTTGRDTMRALRDFTLGCIQAKQRRFFDAIRTSEAPAKNVSRAIHFVARAYREGKLADLPWTSVAEGLAKGEDPIAELEELRTKKALEELELGEVMKGDVDPAGLEELARCGEAIRYIMEHLKPGHQEDNMDLHERFHDIFVGVLEAVAQGRWPEAKYDNEIGRKNLACLKPEQEALWRAESVTGATSGAPNMRELAEAVHVLRGVARALRDHPEELKTEGMGRLGFTKYSLERLEQAHAAVIAELHQVEKGSDEHRRLGRRAAELAVPVSMLRFCFAVSSAKGDAQAVLLELRPYLGELSSALRELQVPILAKAIDRAAFVASTLTTSPKEGTYAADEDSLYALITSTHTGGCVGYDGFRRYSNVAFAANAGDKLIRAYDGEKFVARAIFKLFEGELEGWKGPVLWLNNIATTNGGNEDHKKLIARHALLKAQAMGVPLLSSEVDLGELAQGLGLQQVRIEVKAKVPDNATGTSFTNYQIVPTSSHDIRTKMAGKAYFEHTHTCNVVMPSR